MSKQLIVERERPVFSKLRSSEQLNLGPRRGNLDLNSPTFTEIGIGIKGQVRVIGAGHFRHDVEHHIARGLIGQDDIVGIVDR